MMHLPPPSDEHPFLLITDFDGTMTERDFYRRALEHLPHEVREFWKRYEQGEITHFEALRDIFAQLPGDEDRVMPIARETRLDPHLQSAIQTLRAGGWQTVVVSAGTEWYSRRLLAEQGVELPVISNPGSLAPGDGLRMERPPRESPFYSATIGVDKAAVVRAALERFERVAFAGDSRHDRPAAELVPSERRFACGWLADRFNEDHIPYRRFECWSQIPRLLLGSAENPIRDAQRPQV